jgi:hypothetical protein
LKKLIEPGGQAYFTLGKLLIQGLQLFKVYRKEIILKITPKDKNYI